jgi:hypothetical protein
MRKTTKFRSGRAPASTRLSPRRSATRRMLCHGETRGPWSRAPAFLSPTTLHTVMRHPSYYMWQCGWRSFPARQAPCRHSTTTPSSTSWRRSRWIVRGAPLGPQAVPGALLGSRPGLESRPALGGAARSVGSLLSQVQAQTSHQPGARAQLAAALSADEFRCLEAMLTSTGLTFNDVYVAGDAWTVSAGGQRSFPGGKGRRRKHQQ